MKKPDLFSSFLPGKIIILIMFFSFSIYGQIQYTDVTPDQELLYSKNVYLDLNGDGVTDCYLKLLFTTKYFTTNYEYFIVTDSLIEVAVINDSAAALEVNKTVNDDLTWSKNDTTYLYNDVNQYYHYGQWYYVQHHAFLGIRVKNGDDFNYAWIRVNVIESPNGNFHLDMFIADFALNKNPNQEILTGQGLPSFATSVHGFDGNDYLDARDVSVSFTRAYDESLFSEYRIILAKADDTTAYDLNVLNQVPEESFTTVLVDLADSDHTVSLQFNQNILDKDGDSIERYLEYKVHILNVSVTGDASNNLLSLPSSPFFLSSVSEAVGTPMAYDVDELGTAGDIKVEFDKVDREDFIMEYRIFISHYEDTLSLDDALGLPSNHYTSIIPDGNHPQIILSTGQVDINGQTITEDVDYIVYVLSVADSVFSLTSALSAPSRRFMLRSPNILMAGQIEGDYIVYTEIDTILYIQYGDTEHIDTLSIDIDQNGTRDIKFIGNYDGSPTGWEYVYLHAVGFRNNKIMLCDHSNHSNWTAMLYENNQIGEQFIFSNENTILHEHVYGSWDGNDNYGIGHFRPFYDSYVGFCLMDYSQPVYGWVRITKVSGGYLFKGHAYEMDPSGIVNNNHSKSVILYPNPANDFIYLETVDLVSPIGPIELKIFDIRGLLISEFLFSSSSVKLNISNYSAGIYFCMMKFKDNTSETLKFVVR